MKNERTSKRVARIAAKVLAINIPSETPLRRGPLAELVAAETHLTWGDIRAIAASCLTQTPDTKVAAIAHKRGAKNQRHLVRVKAEGFDQVLIGPVELMEPQQQDKIKRMIAAGVMTPNEGRKKFNQKPITGSKR